MCSETVKIIEGERVNLVNLKFLCLECRRNVEAECKTVEVDAEKKYLYCNGKQLACECGSKEIVPYEVRRYKVTIECEYSLEVSPVANDTIHAQEDGTDEEILTSIIDTALSHSADSYKLVTIEQHEKVQKQILKWVMILLPIIGLVAVYLVNEIKIFQD